MAIGSTGEENSTGKDVKVFEMVVTDCDVAKTSQCFLFDEADHRLRSLDALSKCIFPRFRWTVPIEQGDFIGLHPCLEDEDSGYQGWKWQSGQSFEIRNSSVTAEDDPEYLGCYNDSDIPGWPKHSCETNAPTYWVACDRLKGSEAEVKIECASACKKYGYHFFNQHKMSACLCGSENNLIKAKPTDDKEDCTNRLFKIPKKSESLCIAKREDDSHGKHASMEIALGLKECSEDDVYSFSFVPSSEMPVR